MRPPASRPWPLLAVLLLSLGYGALATAPLWTDPANRLPANADVYLKSWAVAWVAHRLPQDPARVFDANMFFPHPRSLLFDDSVLPLGAMAVPLRALGASVALSFNLLLLLSFPVAAGGAYLLARELGACPSGAGLGGFVFAFGTYQWDHVVHLHSLWVGWLPLGMVALARTLRGGRLTDAAVLAFVVALQALTSGYYAMLMAVVVGVLVAVEGPGAGLRRLGLAAAALLAAFVLAAPELLARREVVREHGFTRRAAEAEVWSAGPSSFLDPGAHAAWPHTRWMHAQFEHREPLYPGAVVWGLAAVALYRSHRERRVRILALLGLVGAALSFGPVWRVGGVNLPGPFLLLRALPGGDLLRTPSRLAVLTLLALAILAALGWTAWVTGWGRRRRAVLLAAFVSFAAAEAYPAGLRSLFRQAPPFPPSAGWLATAERGAVLELPWDNPNQAGRYLYWSTRHWQPLVNGYASFEPRGSLELGLLGRRWPSAYTARRFRAAGIRYVVVHASDLPPHLQERLSGEPLPEGVSLAADLGDDRVYEIAATLPAPSPK